MNFKNLASNYKTLLALPFMVMLYLIGTGVLPLAEGVDVVGAMAILLVPILALIASDHMDTYQLFKSGVLQLASFDFKDDRIDKFLDASAKGLEFYEKMLQKDIPPSTTQTTSYTVRGDTFSLQLGDPPAVIPEFKRVVLDEDTGAAG